MTMSPIPRIVLAGDQNAGKTALVERLCSLSMDIPSCGTMEWHVSPGPMFAQVYIAWNSPLDELAPRIPFGHPVYDLSLLENLVRRAQIATFLHDDEASQVLNYRDAAVLSLYESLANFKGYTSHVVHVVYRHPDIPWEATIVDLPGVLIDGPRDLVKLSQEITLAHIRVATNVIVVVMPLTSAKCWSTTWNLVQEEDPDQHRTIGLVTKLSCVPDAAEELMSEHPPFFVYHPREGRQHLSLSYSRARENDFFRESLPWSAFSDRRFLGIDAFLAEAKRISKELHFHSTTFGSPTLVRRENGVMPRLAVPAKAGAVDASNDIEPVKNITHDASRKGHHHLMLFLVSLIVLGRVFTLLHMFADSIIP